jgi:hypothetical protein
MFDLQIDSSQGEILHNEIFEKGVVKFIPDVPGDYSIHIKNQSSKPASVSLNYGFSHEFNQITIMMTAFWVLLVLGGSYLILHKNFINTYNF